MHISQIAFGKIVLLSRTVRIDWNKNKNKIFTKQCLCVLVATYPGGERDNSFRAPKEIVKLIFQIVWGARIRKIISLPHGPQNLKTPMMFMHNHFVFFFLICFALLHFALVEYFEYTKDLCLLCFTTFSSLNMPIQYSLDQSTKSKKTKIDKRL